MQITFVMIIFFVEVTFRNKYAFKFFMDESIAYFVFNYETDISIIQIYRLL